MPTRLDAKIRTVASWALQTKSSRIALLIASFGFFLALPSLGAGLHTLDDPDQQRLIEAHLRGQRAPVQPWWDLYNLVNGDRSEAEVAIHNWARPWWTAPTVKIQFFRPVAVATLYLDRVLFGQRYWLAHLHSALWYFALCYLVSLVLHRLSTQRSAATMAALLFAVDDAHSAPISWLAGRNAIVAATFLALALLLYDQAGRTDRLRFALGSAFTFLLALLSAENVISGAPLFAFYSLLLDRRALRARLASVGSVATVALGWLYVNRALGFGSVDSGSYIDPLRDSVAFWSALGPRYWGLLNLQFGIPNHFLTVATLNMWMTLNTLLCLLCVSALALWTLRSIGKGREVAFWALSCTVGLVPLAAAPPHERLLTHVGIGLWMLVALMAVSIFRSARTLSKSARAAAALLCCLPFVSYLLASPVALALASAPRPTRQFASPQLNAETNLAQRSAIIVNAHSLLLPMEVLAERAREGLPVPSRATVLGATEHEVEITRLDAHTLELYSPSGYLLDPFATYWRGPSAPLKEGDRISVDGYDVLVVKVTPDGRPLRVRFNFRLDLDDASLCLLYSDGLELKPFALPGLGQHSIIPSFADRTKQRAPKR